MSPTIYSINRLPCRLLLQGMLLAAALFIQGCGGASSDTPEPTTTPPPPIVKEVPPNVIVIFTDDHGYADLGVQNEVTDVVTPNIDNLALSGVRFTNGYVTAPQCTPSRAGLLTGQYQQRFGLDENVYTPMPLSVKTLAERFQDVGYKTGMAGKWHLEVNNGSKYWAAENYPDMQPFKSDDVPIEVRRQYFPDNRGFDDTFMGYNVWYWQNFTKTGESIEAQYVKDTEYRIDLVNKAAVQFIHRHSDEPFFLYVAPYGPHVPLAAIDKDLSLFSEDMAVRRRYGLAMLHAIDRGVGDIVSALEQYQLMDNTLIIFASDNGAPIDETMPDLPISELGVWDGSLNTPLAGEKGMLTEGGIKVPFIAS